MKQLTTSLQTIIQDWQLVHVRRSQTDPDYYSRLLGYIFNFGGPAHRRIKLDTLLVAQKRHMKPLDVLRHVWTFMHNGRMEYKDALAVVGDGHFAPGIDAFYRRKQ